MKSIQNKKSSVRRIVLVSAIALTLITIVTLIVYFYTQHSNTPKANDPGQHKSAGNKEASGAEQGNTEEIDRKEKETVKQFEGSKPDSLSGVVNYKGIVDDRLVIRVTIDQSIESGSCVLTLSNNKTSIQKTSDIQNNPSSSSCSGFDVPVSELSSGKWTIDILAKDNAGQSLKLSDEIEVD